jgi:hypothetical protein
MCYWGIHRRVYSPISVLGRTVNEKGYITVLLAQLLDSALGLTNFEENRMPYIPKILEFISLCCSLVTFRRRIPYSLHLQCIVHRPKTSTNARKKYVYLLIIGLAISWIYFQLHFLILSVASLPIKKGPSEEQKKKMEGLMNVRRKIWTR